MGLVMKIGRFHVLFQNSHSSSLSRRTCIQTSMKSTVGDSMSFRTKCAISSIKSGLESLRGMLNVLNRKIGISNATFMTNTTNGI